MENTAEGAGGFDVAQYYADYPRKVIARPGYPARAAYKSYLAWREFGKVLLAQGGDVQTVADVGGCFGFGLNAFLYHGNRILGHEMKGDLYELGESFRQIGRMLFPHITFYAHNFATSELPRPYDVTLLFDVLEHMPDVQHFLDQARHRTRFAIIKTPLETTQRRERLAAAGKGEPYPSGEAHPDGHLHFFTLPMFLDMLRQYFDVCSVWIVPLRTTYHRKEIIIPESVDVAGIAGSRTPAALSMRSLVRTLIRFTLPGLIPSVIRDRVDCARVRLGLACGDAFVLARSPVTADG